MVGNGQRTVGRRIMRVDVLIAPTADDVGRCTAGLIVRLALDAVGRRGRCTLALSGGRSPLAAYAHLARAPGVPWPDVHVFWGDERCVPREHPDSNFRAANAVLLFRVPVPPDHVHRIHGEAEPDDEALRYEGVLRRVVGGTLPRLDVILLGLGEDGHTASLFPGSPALGEGARLVVAVDPPPGAAHRRITFTVPLIGAGRAVVFVVTGASKADAVWRVLARREMALPASRVMAAHGGATWVLDEEAAHDLSQALRDRGRRAWARQTRPVV